MKIVVYKTKRHPLKSVSLEKPDIHYVFPPKTNCGEKRKVVPITKVPLKLYVFDTLPCKPPCVGIATRKT